MPKYKSIVISEEKELSRGRVKPGQTAWIPLDDAAKMSSVTQKAIDLGKYTPKDPNEVENLKRVWKKKQDDDLRRRGLID